MTNKTKLTIAGGIMIWMAGACFAQNDSARAAEPSKYFRLDFVVKEVEGGKTMNARHYATTIVTGTGEASVIRTGSKLPIAVGGQDTQITYIDVGVSIDCRWAKETGGDLALNVTAEISSAGDSSRQPMVRQNKWSSNVIAPMGKPTVIFSSDDVASKGQMQLELTATPVR